MSKIRLGVCAPLEHIDAIAAMGYDYLEVNLTWLAGLDEAAYQQALATARAASIGVEAANVMLPGHLPVTGPDVDSAALRAHLSAAYARAAEMGIRVIVFGSGGARRLPDGFPASEGWRQIRDFLQMAGGLAADNGLTIAIEPLHRGECNMLNYVSEATLLSALLAHPAVGVLGDTYHMGVSSEPLTALPLAGESLWHVHICHSMGDASVRVFPRAGDGENYADVFATLRGMGYAHRVSIEAGSDDLLADAKAALAPIREALNAAI